MPLGKLTYLCSLSACEVIRLTRINHTHRPLFFIALSRFHSEVKREDDFVLDVTSAQELLRQTRAIEPTNGYKKQAVYSIKPPGSDNSSSQ